MPKFIKNQNKKKQSLQKASSSASSSSSPAQSNAGRRHGSNDTTDALKKKEKCWLSIAGRPPLLRQPALRTFVTLMSQPDSTVTQAVGFVCTSFTYQATNFSGIADYLTLFDSYRIREVELVVRPAYTTGFSTFNPPTVYTVIDYDDNSTLTATQLREYSNLELSCYETVVRHFVPAVNIPTYVSGGASTGDMTVFAPWIDAATTTVEHCGVKIGIDGGTLTNSQQLDINHRFLVEFRCTR
jgi:hypothetical protein